MNNEYVIINKTVLKKRIEDLRLLSNQPETSVYDVNIEGFVLEELEQFLLQSTPLIPEIEKAFDEGKGVGIISYQPKGHTLDKELYNERKQDYISNLKLDI